MVQGSVQSAGGFGGIPDDVILPGDVAGVLAAVEVVDPENQARVQEFVAEISETPGNHVLHSNGLQRLVQ